MDISQLRKGPHLSATAINDYIDCGLLYKLARIDRLKPDFIPDALKLGATIHRVLEDFYRERMLGNRLQVKDLHEIFEQYWKEAAEGREDIQYKEGKDFETLLMEGKELLSTYYHKLPEDDFRILAIEEPFRFHLDNLDIPIVGITDLVEEDSAGTVIVTDWKTSSRAYSTDEVDTNFQLTVYQMGLKANGYHDREILLRLDCLIKTKSPKFEQYYTTRGELEERRLIKKIQKVWEGIEREVFIPNDTGWKCKGCQYKSHCDAWFLRR
jgi:putative RecB family exonuclease